MSTYNKEQLALIQSPLDTHVVGVAGAGTGKTTTILGRTQRILETYPTGQIVLITFTREASKDLSKKLSQVVSEHDLRRITVGTFHSVISRLIRENAQAIGLQTSVSIIDEASTTTMYRTVIEKNKQSLETMNAWFISENNQKLTRKNFNTVAGLVSTLVNQALPNELESGQFGEDTINRMKKANTYINNSTSGEVLHMLWKTFIDSMTECRETNTINYDHILFIGYLMTKSSLLDQFSNRLVHMIVDEYQDTNALQDAFVRHVAGNNLTIVGDVDQSIYEFRGGRPDLIEKHAKNSIVCNLTTNYRSYQPILDIANSIIKYNTTGKSIRRELISAKELDENFSGVKHLVSERDSNEAVHIINEIKFLMKKGVEPKDIAILVPSRMTMPAIIKELNFAKVPINDTTKFADFMNSDVMKDTLNFLKVFTNPKDIYAFLGIIDKPKRGIGPKAIETLSNMAKELDLSLVEFLLSEGVKDIGGALQKKVEDFIAVYLDLINPYNDLTFDKAIDDLLEKTGYLAWIKGLKNNESHLNNITTLKGMVKDYIIEYEKTHTDYSLYDIANSFTFDMTASVRKDDIDGVCISTVHGSKGLEWDYVFILGMEDESFLGSHIVDEEDLESRRRLAYVAVTRAIKGLTISSTKYRMTFGPERKLTECSFFKEFGYIPILKAKV